MPTKSAASKDRLAICSCPAQGHPPRAVSIHWTGPLEWTTGLTFDLIHKARVNYVMKSKELNYRISSTRRPGYYAQRRSGYYSRGVAIRRGLTKHFGGHRGACGPTQRSREGAAPRSHTFSSLWPPLPPLQQSFLSVSPL